MEKLTLNKFNDFKLQKEQLSFVHAGEGDTAGGVYVEHNGSGTHYFVHDSDYVNSSGATFYTNLQYRRSRRGNRLYTNPHYANDF